MSGSTFHKQQQGQQLQIVNSFSPGPAPSHITSSLFRPTSTLPTEYGSCKLKIIFTRTRNDHEPQRKENPNHSACVSGCLGLVYRTDRLAPSVSNLQLKQKRYHHTPQTKVRKFFVSILGGLKHLQEISLAAHPLDKDRAVAKAWGQTA